jgi:hypothetical protein
MIPPRNFPVGSLKLLEMDGKNVVRVHAEFPSTSKYRDKIHNLRNDLLMVNPRLDLKIVENNAI